MDTIVRLTEARDGFGGKAAHLAALLGGGFDVPDGFAIAPDAPLSDLAVHLDALGDVPVAVRSSALDEDGVAASFAGIYESVVDVRGAADIQSAIAKVRESAFAPRALAYRDEGTPVRMGVVVQRLVRAECAGVMFTADPVTGDRDARVITAVRGLGEALVAGEQGGEEWLVVAGRPVRRRALSEPVLSEAQVRELAALGERVAAHFGAPQDIEWVIEGGRISLVQARPITALPEPVRWQPPHPTGGWLRNFRWGEWLSDPVSPLFGSWFLPRAAAVLDGLSAETFGIRPPPPTYALVHGWYYYAPLGTGGMLTLLGGLFRRPGTIIRGMRASSDPVAAAPLLVEPYRRAYDDEILPRYRVLAEEELDDEPYALIAYVDRACDLHGEIMFNMTHVGGFAWKVETALAKFFRAHCADIEGAPHELVAALAPVEPSASHHAYSLDWMHPTAGELGLDGVTVPVREEAVRRREELERTCLDRLTPELRPHFEALLALARDYARVREQQAHDLTLAWPKVREAIRRVGAMALAAGSITELDDVFWLERDELEPALDGRRLQRKTAERRATWNRQRKLAPPLRLGKMVGAMADMWDALPRALRGQEIEGSDVTIVGMPASAGRATGSVRIVRSPADFDRLQPGEVLVAPTTAPAWTPLFARAVAVVTDGGSVAAHASLVAREYGIPAVVGTVDATQRLRDGQQVTVDGTTGRVDLLEPA